MLILIINDRDHDLKLINTHIFFPTENQQYLID